MTNPLPNNTPDLCPGGPPMVRIDGAAVRRIREEKGLTQLYVATVVQVTTDTISRWENRRYPTIKKENAEKLAEALEVELTALLEVESPGPAAPPPSPELAAPPVEPEPTAPPETLRTTATSRLLPWLAGALLLALALVLLARHFLAGPGEPLPLVTATRILPAHVPPGQEFPVLLRVASPPPASFALIIREILPPGCRFVIATPASIGPTGREGQIKWVSRLEGRERLFAYRLTSPPSATAGATLRFQGQVVAGSRGETTAAVTGPEQMTVAPYHWADRDRDNRIDDEEILWVYDFFGTPEGFDDLRDEVDLIWTAGGYRWDGKLQKYRVEQ